MVLAAEFMISGVPIHPRQGYRDGDDPSSILRGFRDPHLRYGGLVGPNNVASLKYLHTFWKSR